jgi:hypothetical protein
MDWMGLEKIKKKFDLFGIQTHPIPLNPHGLRANRTSPYGGKKEVNVLNLQHPVVVNTSSIKKNQCLKQISVGKAG